MFCVRSRSESAKSSATAIEAEPEIEALGEREDMTSEQEIHDREKVLYMMPRLYDTDGFRNARCVLKHAALSSEDGEGQITPESASEGDARCRAREEKWHYGLLPE